MSVLWALAGIDVQAVLGLAADRVVVIRFEQHLGCVPLLDDLTALCDRLDGNKVKQLIKVTSDIALSRFGKRNYEVSLPQDPGQAGGWWRKSRSKRTRPSFFQHNS